MPGRCRCCRSGTCRCCGSGPRPGAGPGPGTGPQRREGWATDTGQRGLTIPPSGRDPVLSMHVDIDGPAIACTYRQSSLPSAWFVAEQLTQELHDGWLILENC